MTDEENIVFNGDGLISGPTLMLTGRANRSDTLVAFSSSESLLVPAHGQSRIEGADGSFTDLSVYLWDPQFDFSGLIFNLNTSNRSAGNALITVHSPVGVDATYNLSLGNGQNFLTILATEGQRIKQVDISSNIGVNSINIDDGRQFRISDIQDTIVPAADIPEPGILWLIGIGFLSLAAVSPRRASHPA